MVTSPDTATAEKDEIEITPEMIEAGVNRLWYLEGQVAEATLVEEVFLAMWRARLPRKT